jgi:hypothetical protein
MKSCSPGSALRGEIADAIREYCHSISPAAVQMSHGVERIYYAGISLDGLTDAIFAALGAGVAQTPTEAQIERGAKAMCEWKHGTGSWDTFSSLRDHFVGQMRAGLCSMSSTDQREGGK